MYRMILMWIKHNYNIVYKAILSLLMSGYVLFGVVTCKQNQKLTEELNLANNNIEAYQGSLAGSQQANNVLRLDIEELQQQNDKLLHNIDSVRKELKIKSKQISTAATQTQVLLVKESKGVQGDLSKIIKDTVYNDSIKYNDLTTVHYTIGKDTVSVGIDLKNTQYLYIFSKREYKNKKSFLKRLFTFDFKKVTKYKYEIVNTNDLLKSEDIRIVESTDKK